MYITDLLHTVVDGLENVAEANKGELHAAVDGFFGFLEKYDEGAAGALRKPAAAEAEPEPQAAAESIPAETKEERIARIKAELATLEE